MRSNKPEAKKFKRWITHEVLPMIRKTGSYEIDSLSEIDLITKSAQALKKVELNLIEHDNRFGETRQRFAKLPRHALSTLGE